ncbi:MAG TPA: NAD(P)-dependent oxidoreductase [Stellaceae bacterium]|jgi:3-hydroxyisobutyrate dehydrogenase|nr:NAD(P)-dependent oxidoreductase [Stellaceae bacterium]
MPSALTQHKIGWIGAGGRMGYAMAERLAKAGADVAVWNRTRAKAEPLAKSGCSIVDSPAALADRDIVFITVAASHDLEEVALGAKGVLAGNRQPKILIDSSTVSEDSSAKVREAAKQRGVAMLAAPVSGNAKVVKAGKLTFVVSGPRAAYDTALPYLDALGQGSSYVGEGELARMVKICHNVFLGAVIQSLVEVTVLAEKGGVPRHAFLDFINKSVMGSTFTRYKSPSLVRLDFTPTFTPPLLKKDLDLGLDAADKTGVAMPLTALTREIVQSLIGRGHVEDDFATLLLQQADASGLKLVKEDVAVDDGLH